VPLCSWRALGPSPPAPLPVGRGEWLEEGSRCTVHSTRCDALLHGYFMHRVRCTVHRALIQRGTTSNERQTLLHRVLCTVHIPNDEPRTTNNELSLRPPHRIFSPIVR